MFMIFPFPIYLLPIWSYSTTINYINPIKKVGFMNEGNSHSLCPQQSSRYRHRTYCCDFIAIALADRSSLGHPVGWTSVWSES